MRFCHLWQVRRQTISIPLRALKFSTYYFLVVIFPSRREQETPNGTLCKSPECSVSAVLPSPCSSPFSGPVFQDFWLLWPPWMLYSVSSDLGKGNKTQRCNIYPYLLFLDIGGSKLDKTWIIRTCGLDVLLFKWNETPPSASYLSGHTPKLKTGCCSSQAYRAWTARVFLLLNLVSGDTQEPETFPYLHLST